ncbi:MAG: hypothetical protein JWN95_3649 [Frankiales bacterium]|nr:hypothetical protein [Frankiales bacterium]
MQGNSMHRSEGTTESPDRFRILCLHGYHGNANLLSRQLAHLASAIPGAEFMPVNAPSLAEQDFGWWHSPSRGWARTRAWVTELFTSQPRFDGVFGFSQGGAMTGLLCGMRAQPDNPVDFDFAIMVGGFKNDAPEHAELYRTTFALPSLHIIGEADRVIPPHESLALAAQFENPIVLKHQGGHIIPPDRPIVAGLRQFIGSMPRLPAVSGSGPDDSIGGVPVADSPTARRSP